MRFKLRLFFLLSSFFLLNIFSNATHIVGGELYYEHLGGYNYQVTLRFYRDCGSGNAGYPSEVRLRAFYDGGNQWVQLNAPFPGSSLVPPTVDTCVVAPGICVEEAVYTGVMYLPPVEGGYHILFDFGNRNASLDNIISPLNETEAWYAFVPNDTNIIYTSLPSDTPLWLEDFTLGNGTTIDGGATAWTRTIVGGTDWAEVQDNVFEARDTDGEIVWSSEVINIAAFPNGVDLTADLLETGNQDNNDYVRTFYKLNGGPEIQFTTNGNLNNDFDEATASELFVIGTTVEIVVRIDNDENDKRHYIDNVAVTPSKIWYEDFSLPNNTNSDVGTTAWTRTINGATNYSEVRDNIFETNRTIVEAVWRSEYIDISAEINGVDMSVELSETGDLEAADYIRTFYIINGGTEIQFTTNGNVNDDFDEVVASVNGVIGDSVQIVIRSLNSHISESHYYDNIAVCAARVPIDTTYLAGGPNSSPIFTSFPPIFVCSNEPFCFDHSATDADGDSLVYYLCAPYSAWNNQPYNIDAIDPPPFDANGYPIIDTVNFVTGYSSQQPFGPGTTLNLDANTGELCGDPNGNVGQYVLGVCVDEYRGDSLINTNKKDFQFNTVYCPPISTALLSDTSICTTSFNTTVAFPFLNVTEGDVFWDFGDLTTLADTSISYTPSYNYSDTGTYTITLIINRGTPCVDTGTALLHIQYIEAQFGDDSPSCVNQPITFSDSTILSSGTNGAYSWTFGDANISSLTNPTHTYTVAGIYDVELIVFSSAGCSDTVTRTVQVIDEITLDAGNDITTCSDQTVNLSAIMTGSNGILWTGGTGTFANDTLASTTYTFSPSEIAASAIAPISVVLTACSRSNGSCNEVCDSLIVSINGQPTLTITGDNSVCENNSEICLTAAITNASGVKWDPFGARQGVFTPSDTSLIVCYTPHSNETPGIFQITAQPTGFGDCNLITENHLVVVTAAPIVTAGPDDTTCINNPVATLSASGGTGTVYSWVSSSGCVSCFGNATIENTTYTPSATDLANGCVTLTFSSTLNAQPGDLPFCDPVTDNMTLCFSPAPTVDAGTDQLICENNSLTTLNGVFGGSTGATWTTITGSIVGFGNVNSMNTTYQPSTADSIAGFIDIVLTTTGNGGCSEVKDTMRISFSPAPTVDAGSDVSICSNNPITILNGSINAPATGGIWSGGSGTYSVNSTTLNATYNGVPADTFAGSIILTLTTSGSVGCNEVSDEMIINFTASPTVDAGINDTVCANNSEATLSATVNIATGVQWSGGSGVINSPTNLTTTYTPSNGEVSSGIVELYVETTGNGLCLPDRDTVYVIISQAPTVNAGADQTVCSNNADVQLNGSVINATGGTWTRIGDGTFDDVNILNAVYTPGANDINTGSAIIILETTGNGGCLSVFDTMNITISNAPTVDAGPNQSVCANNNVVTLAGVISNISTGGTWSGGATFTPGQTTLNANFVPSQTDINNGTVTLTLTTTGSGNCNEVSDDMIITITPSPTIDIGVDQNVCADAPSVIIPATLTVATGVFWTNGGGTYSTSNTANPLTYIPSPNEILAGTATIIGLSTNNSNCSPVSDTMNISIVPAPIVDAGPDQIVCGNVSSVNIGGTVTNVGGGTWSSSSQGTSGFGNINNLTTTYSPSNADTANGSVTLTLTTTGNGLCNAITDNIVISFEDQPSIDAGPDESICSNEFPIQLQGAGSPATWSGGAGNISNPILLNATYTPDAGEIGNSVSLILTTNNVGTCPQIRDTVTFTLPAGPTAFAGNDIAVCGDINSVNLSGTIGGTANGFTWLTTGTGTFLPTNNLNTTYNPTQQDKDNNGVQIILATSNISTCPNVTDTLNLIISDAPTVDAGFPQTVCSDIGCIDLDGTITVASGGIWTINGAGNGTFGATNVIDTSYCIGSTDTANGSVTLTLTTTGNGSCLPVTDDVVITITPAPTVDAGNDIAICADSSEVQLNGSSTIAGGISWTTINGTNTNFSPNTTDPTAQYTISTTDTAQANQPIIFVINSTGNGTCNAVTDTMELTISPVPTINVGSDLTICADQPIVPLSSVITIAGGISWTTGGNGTFDNSNSLSPNYTVGIGGPLSDTALGIVTLTGTTILNGQCRAVSDNMNVTITPIVTVNAGPNQFLCASVSTVTMNGQVTVATGGVWSTLGTGTFANSTNLNTIYTPSAADTAAGCVNLILTSTGNGLCSPVVDTVEICFSPVPIVEAGPDVTICADSGFVQLNGIVSNAGGGIWSTSGTGTFFPNVNTLNTQYQPSNADTSLGTVKLYLTTTGNGVCFSIIDSMEINITPTPTIDLGPDLTICGDLRNVNLSSLITVAGNTTWSTSGNGVFSPNVGVNTVYSVTDLDTLAGLINIFAVTSGSGACKEVTDQISLTITDIPTADAGLDQDICGDQFTINLAGSVTVATGGAWTTTGTGTFSPDTSALNATYNITTADSAAGFINLILTTVGNGTCNPVSDTMTLRFQNVPTVDIGLDVTVCADTSYIQLNSSMQNSTTGEWTTTGPGSFNVNEFDLSAIYLLDSTYTNGGSVTLTLTTTDNGICPAASDSLILNITALPTIEAGPNQVVCADNPTAYFLGSVNVSTGGVWSTPNGEGTFLLNDSVTNPAFTPSIGQINAGIAVLSFTSTGNGQCKAVSDNLTLTINPIPIVDAGVDQTVCADIDSFALSGIVTNAGGGIWSATNLGVFSPSDTILNTTYDILDSDTANGSVSFILTSRNNGVCQPVSDTINLNFMPLPVAQIGPFNTFCVNETGVVLEGSVLNAGGLVWSSTGTGVFTNNTTDTIVTYTPDTLDLLNGSAAIYLISTSNGLCPADTDLITLEIAPIASADAGSDRIVCTNNPETELNGSFVNASTGIWTTSGTGTFSDSTDFNATYFLSVADLNNNSITIHWTQTDQSPHCDPVTDSMVIIVSPGPTVDAGPSQTICGDQDSVGVLANITIATGVIWSTSGTGVFIDSLLLSTTYLPSSADVTAGFVTLYATTTGNGLCLEEVDSLILTITPPIIGSIGNDTTICADQTIISLTANVAVATGGIWSSSSSGAFNPNNTTIPTIDYVISSADTANGSVDIYFETTGNGLCNSVFDTITINFQNIPSITVSPDAICSNEDTVNIGGVFSNATGMFWTTLGDGVFTPSNLIINTNYVPGANDRLDGGLILVAQTTGNGVCAARMDSVILTISNTPVADAGANITVCADTLGVQLNGSVLNAGGGVWTTTGDGFFNDSSLLNAIYTPGLDDIDSGYVDLYLTTIFVGICAPYVDTVRIIITPAPTVQIVSGNSCTSSDTLFLTGNVTIATGGIWSTSGDGNFQPNNTDLNVDYLIGVGDSTAGEFTITLSTTGSGMCKEVLDTLDITLIPAPVALAGNDTLICGDNTDILLSGSVSNATGGVWTTSGSGTFDDANLLNATYTYSQADIDSGNIVLTLTTTGNGICNEFIDSFTITFTPIPTVNAGDGNVCIDNPVIPILGTVTGATGGVWSCIGCDGTFDDVNNLSTNYNSGANDTIVDSVTLVLCTTGNGNCQTYCDTSTIQFDPAPTATVGDNIVCADTAGIDLNGAVTIATGGIWTSLGGGTFSSTTDLNATYVPSQAVIDSGRVLIVLTTTGNQDCNAVMDTMTLTINPAPIVDAGIDFDVCADTVLIPLLGTVTNATGGEWTVLNGTGIITSPNNLSTTYAPTSADSLAGSVCLILTSTGNGLCNAVVDTVCITILPAPTVSAGDGTVCADQFLIQLNGTMQNATGVVWTTTGAGSFIQNHFDINAQYARDTADVSAGQVTLVITTTGNGLCKAVSDTIVYNLAPPPSVEAGSNQGICASVDTVLLAGSVVTATGGVWSTLGTGTFTDSTDLNAGYVPSAADSAAGQVIIRLRSTGNIGCDPASDSLIVFIAPVPTVDAGPDTLIICASAPEVPISGLVTIATGGIWSTLGSGVFTPSSIDLTTAYKTSIADTAGGSVNLVLTTTGNGVCPPVTDTMTIAFTPVVTVYAGADTTICADLAGGIDLTSVITIANGGIWSTSGTGVFNDSSLTPTVNYTPSNQDISDSIVVISLLSTDNGTCLPSTDNMLIFINPAPTVDAGFDIQICADADSVRINGSVTVASGGEWTTLGDGLFVNSSVLNTSYLLGTGDVANKFVDLVLTTTGNNLCNPVTDTLRIDITDLVTLFAGNDTTLCQDAIGLPFATSFTVATGGVWTTTGNGIFSSSVVADTGSYTFLTDTSLSSVSLIFTTTGNGTCKAATDTIVVDFQPLPDADAGLDQTICADNPQVIMNGSVTNTAGGTWSGGGVGGSFVNVNDLSTTYNVSSSDINLGVVSIFLTTDPVTICGNDIDNMLIIVNPFPTIDAGLDQEFCVDVPTITLSGSFTVSGGAVWSTPNGTGTFVDSTDVNTVYNQGPGDESLSPIQLILTTTGNGLCNPVSDTMLYVITPAPSVDAGSDDTLCADIGSFILNGASFNNTISSNVLWTTTTLGTFNDPTLVNAEFTPDVSIIPVGNVLPLVINFQIETEGSGTCTERFDTKSITLMPIPTIDAGADDTVCIDIDTIYLNSNITNAVNVVWNGGAGTFPNGNLGTNVTYIPASNERVAGATLAFTAETIGTGICLNYTDQVFVTFDQAPSVDAGPDQIVCADLLGVNLNGIVTLASGGSWNSIQGAGSWTNQFTEVTTYVVSPTDTINGGPILLELTSNPYKDCKQYKDTIRIDFDPEPTVSAGDASICADVTGFTLNGSFSNSFGVVWSSGNGVNGGTFSPNANDLNPVYIPSAQDILDTNIVLYITNVITTSTCIPKIDSINVIVIPLPVADGGDDLTICRGGTTDLVGQFNNNGTTQYQWYTINGVPIGLLNPIVTIISNQDTSFVYEVTDLATGCTQYDTINVTMYDPPILNLPDHYCMADGLLLDGVPVPATPIDKFQWLYDGSPLNQEFGTTTYLADESGTYIFSFILDQCKVYDTTIVTDTPTVVTTDLIVCIGEDVDLTVDAPNAISYEWTDSSGAIVGVTNPSIVTANTDTINNQIFSVEVTDLLGCKSNIDIALRKLPPPNLTLENIPACIGDEVTLNATPTNILDPELLKDGIYEWKLGGSVIAGEIDSTLDVLDAGTYIVEFGIGQCIALDTSIVNFHPLPVPDMEQRYAICLDFETEVTLDAGEATSYLWELSQNSDRLESVFEYGEYIVTIFNEFNCPANDTVEVVEICEPRIFPPTGFIPNGEPCDPDCNECNNCFQIKGGHYQNWNLTIFNRWGEIIFHSTEADNMWDGTYKGEPMPAGVYPWTLYYEGDTPQHFGPHSLSGKITLIK